MSTKCPPFWKKVSTKCHCPRNVSIPSFPPTQVSPLYPQLDPIYYGVDRYYFCIESIEKKVLSTWITFIFSFILYCQGKRTLKITITFNISITFNKSVNMYKCSKGIINIEICTKYLSNETVLNLSMNRGE